MSGSDRRRDEIRPLRLVSGALVAVASALFIAACGGDGNKSSGSGANAAASGYDDVLPAKDQKRGCTLNIVSSDAWAHLDPGQAYYQVDYIVVYATQRPLYSFTPTSPRTAVPDLASGLPKISADGKTVTVRIKPNVRWSPPLNRAVTSADVKYGIERTFNPNVPSGYSHSYYPLVGADKADGGPISGIETPNKTTVVFHLTKDY